MSTPERARQWLLDRAREQAAASLYALPARVKVLCPECGKMVGKRITLEGVSGYASELTTPNLREKPSGLDPLPRSVYRLPVTLSLPPLPEEVAEIQRILLYERMPISTLATCGDHGCLTVDLETLRTTPKKAISATVVRRW